MTLELTIIASVIVLLTVAIILHLCLLSSDLKVLVPSTILSKTQCGRGNDKASDLSVNSSGGRRARRTFRKKLLKSFKKASDLVQNPVEQRELDLPCQRCGKTNAKRKCRFQYCAICCNENKNGCRGHHTSYSFALSLVESAIQYEYLNFDLSYAYLKKCPPGIPSIGTQLTFLNLSNNQLTKLPEDIGSLINLEELFLQYNCLATLPSSLCLLTKLIELDVKNNSLTSLPDGVGDLRRLQILNLTNNHISYLPTSIGKLRRLEELSLHSNDLYELPDEIYNLYNMRVFYAGENNFKALPLNIGNLRKLEELDLSCCAIEILPESLSECLSLVRLWLSNNRLSTLPHHIGRLQKLKELHVRNNAIKYFPASIQRLQLYTFTAQNNNLIDENAAKSMTRSPSEIIPPLIEVAARCVVKHKVPIQQGCIPQHLEVMLETSLQCTWCEEHVFLHYTSYINFMTIGLCYRLPLYYIVCAQCR